MSDYKPKGTYHPQVPLWMKRIHEAHEEAEGVEIKTIAPQSFDPSRHCSLCIDCFQAFRWDMETAFARGAVSEMDSPIPEPEVRAALRIKALLDTVEEDTVAAFKTAINKAIDDFAMEHKNT